MDGRRSGTKRACRSWRAVAVLCAVALVAACGGDDDGGGGTGGQGAGGDAPPGGIEIGVVLSLTGDASTLGVPEAETVELYMEEMSEIAGIPVEWTIHDDQSDPTTAVTLVKQLTDGGVAGVICCTTSPNSMAILDTVQQSGTPTLALGAASTISSPPEEREWIFQTPASDTLTIGAAVEHMLSTGIESAAFLGFDDALGESGRTQFRAVAEENGIEITGEETFGRLDQDVTAQLTQLRSGEPDAYVIWGTPPGVVIAQQNLRALGVDAPVYQSTGAGNQAFIDLGGDAVEGTFMGAPKAIVPDSLPEDDPQRDVLMEYKERYESSHDDPISIFGAQALDAMLIFQSAIERAVEGGASTDDVDAFRQAVRDEIEATEELVGLSGIYNYAPDDHRGLDDRCCVVAEVRDGSWVAVEGE